METQYYLTFDFCFHPCTKTSIDLFVQKDFIVHFKNYIKKYLKILWTKKIYFSQFLFRQILLLY